MRGRTEDHPLALIADCALAAVKHGPHGNSPTSGPWSNDRLAPTGLAAVT